MFSQLKLKDKESLEFSEFSAWCFKILSSLWSNPDGLHNWVKSSFNFFYIKKVSGSLHTWNAAHTKRGMKSFFLRGFPSLSEWRLTVPLLHFSILYLCPHLSDEGGDSSRALQVSFVPVFTLQVRTVVLAPPNNASKGITRFFLIGPRKCLLFCRTLVPSFDHSVVIS